MKMQSTSECGETGYTKKTKSTSECVATAEGISIIFEKRPPQILDILRYFGIAIAHAI